MDLQLKSKTAFVSGSTQGIGFAIANSNLAVYLSSPLSIATNGSALRADGGVLNTII